LLYQPTWRALGLRWEQVPLSLYVRELKRPTGCSILVLRSPRLRSGDRRSGIIDSRSNDQLSAGVIYYSGLAESGDARHATWQHRTGRFCCTGGPGLTLSRTTPTDPGLPGQDRVTRGSKSTCAGNIFGGPTRSGSECIKVGSEQIFRAEDPLKQASKHGA